MSSQATNVIEFPRADVTVRVGSLDVTMPNNRDALHLRWANGNKDAAAVIGTIGWACQRADDLVDDPRMGDKPGSMLELLVALGGILQENQFYKSYKKHIDPIVMSSTLYWDLSNVLVNGSEYDRKYAYVFREAVEQVIGVVALLTGGVEHARRSVLESHAWHHVLHGDPFVAFNQECGPTTETNSVSFDPETKTSTVRVGGRDVSFPDGKRSRDAQMLQWANGNDTAARVMTTVERIKTLSAQFAKRGEKTTVANMSGKMTELIVLLMGELQYNDFFRKNSEMLTPVFLTSFLYQDLARTLMGNDPTDNDRIYAVVYWDYLEQVGTLVALLTGGIVHARRAILEHQAQCHLVNVKTKEKFEKEVGVA